MRRTKTIYYITFGLLALFFGMCSDLLARHFGADEFTRLLLLGTFCVISFYLVQMLADGICPVYAIYLIRNNGLGRKEYLLHDQHSNGTDLCTLPNIEPGQTWLMCRPYARYYAIQLCEKMPGYEWGIEKVV